MQWFKHNTDSHERDTMIQLWAAKDFELIAFYWTLLEMIGKYGEQEERLGNWTVNLATFKLKLGMNAQRSAKLLLKIGQTFKIEVNQISSKSYKLFAHNMLEIKENRGGKNEQKNSKKAVEHKNIRDKEHKNIRDKSTEAEKPASGIAEIRKVFLESYRKEFGKDYPGWGAKENSQAKSWLRSVSLPKAIEYCQRYPSWNDVWVTKRGHPFGVLVSQYVQLEAFLNRPESVMKKMAMGRVAERTAKVLTEDIERLEEMKVYARRDNPGFIPEDTQPEFVGFGDSQQISQPFPHSTQARLPEERSEFHVDEFEADAHRSWSGDEEGQ